MEKTVHMRGKDGVLKLWMLDDVDGVVVITFDNEPVNRNIRIPPFTVALKSSDKWDLIREQIVEIPHGSMGYWSVCRLKPQIISQLKSQTHNQTQK